MYGCVCVPIGNTCPPSSLTGQRLPRTNWAGAGGIALGPEAPPDSATAHGLVLQSSPLETLANFS